MRQYWDNRLIYWAVYWLFYWHVPIVSHCCATVTTHFQQYRGCSVYWVGCHPCRPTRLPTMRVRMWWGWGTLTYWPNLSRASPLLTLTEVWYMHDKPRTEVGEPKIPGPSPLGSLAFGFPRLWLHIQLWERVTKSSLVAIITIAKIGKYIWAAVSYREQNRLNW